MSAIFGIFSKNDRVNKCEAQKMRNSFENVKYDAEGIWSDKDHFFGCLHQQITPESGFEKVPFHDNVQSIVIIADAIIYNRNQLLDELEIHSEQAVVTDISLISEAYKKWKYECPEHLNGDFSFVILDQKSKKMFCCRSHTGARTFYYYNSEKMFSFSTLMKPFFALNEINLELNDSYIADFIGYPGVDHEFDPESTIYNNILQLAPANCMLVDQNRIKKWQYWSVKKTDEIYYKTDGEYEEAFTDLMNKSVNERLRAKKETGILLSGGFDSGTVGVFAAKNLKQKNRDLFSYTQVPNIDYINALSDNKIADESVIVKGYSRKYSNMKTRFVKAENKDPYTEIDGFIETFEQPYKINRNAYWLNACYEAAERDSVGILLTGQFGNFTISWGSFYPYLLYLIQQLKISAYFKEIKQYSKINSLRERKIYLRSILNIMPLFFKKSILSLFKNKENIMEYIPLNKDFSKTMKIEKNFHRRGIDHEFVHVANSLDSRKSILSPHMFTHIGAFLTKFSLKYNMIISDPTCDKAIIEFCLNLPENQFVHNGETRRLIRNFIIKSDYFPSEVVTNMNKRGKQAADWSQRIKKKWSEILKELNEIGNTELERKYLDPAVIAKNISEIEKYDFLNGDNLQIVILFRTLIFSRFLKKFENGLLFG